MVSKLKVSRSSILFALVALVSASVAVFLPHDAPDFFDAYYHYHVAENLATGDGFTEDYAWIYINAADDYPAEAYRYWMPGTAWVATLGMVLFGAQFWAAQIGFALCTWGMMLLAYGLGKYLGGTVRHAWLAGLSALLYSGFLLYWGQIDTFAPYALFGGGALLLMSLGSHADDKRTLYWIGAGVLAACGHMIRNDGLLLVLVGWATLLYPFDWRDIPKRLGWLVLFTGAYLLTMTPWFLRSMAVLGAPLASDGLLTVTLLDYAQIFSYPAEPIDATFAELLAVRGDAFWGLDGLLMRILLYNGLMMLTVPLIVALVKRWNEPFMRPVWIFAVGVHLAMALVFPLPANKGSYIHAITALVPMWAILQLIGVEDIVGWVAKRRKRWNGKTASVVFSTFFAVLFMVASVFVPGPPPPNLSYLEPLDEMLSAEARVMSFDPGEVNYYIDRIGVVTPYSTPDVALSVAQRYQIDYLIMQRDTVITPMAFDEPPLFLEELDFPVDDYRLFRFVRD